MASLVKQKGWYYAQFYSKQHAPQRKQVALKTRTKRVAERLLCSLEDDWALGRYDPWADVLEQPNEELRLLGRAASEFLNNKSHKRPATIKHYRVVLKLLETHLSPTFPVNSILPRHLMECLERTSANDVTKRTYVRHWKVFFRWLVAQELTPSDPTCGVKLRSVPTKFPKYVLPSDIQRLTEVIEQYAQESANVRNGEVRWLVPIIRANVYLGLRAGELCNLRWSDVSLEDRRLVVANTDGFTTKSGKERIIPISEPAYRVLRELHMVRTGYDQDDYVFKTSPTKGKLNKLYLSRRFKFFARRAGLDHVTVHTLRHTACSWLASGGASIEAIRLFAGHSSVQVTQRYMHLAPDIYFSQVTRAFASRPMRGR